MICLIVYKLIIFLFLPNANFKLTGLLRRICDAPRKDGIRVRSLRSFASSNVLLILLVLELNLRARLRLNTIINNNKSKLKVINAKQ